MENLIRSLSLNKAMTNQVMVSVLIKTSLFSFSESALNLWEYEEGAHTTDTRRCREYPLMDQNAKKEKTLWITSVKLETTLEGGVTVLKTRNTSWRCGY